MTIIEINNKVYSVPTQWNELTGRQLVQVTKLFDDGTLQIEEARLVLLKILTGMGWWRFALTDILWLEEFLYLTDFLIQENTLTKNHLPKYKGFYGPASDFDNLRMEEFVYSEDFFLRWKEDEANTELLDSLVAVLYRKGKEGYNQKLNAEGDVRVPFNEFVSAWHAHKHIARWPMEVKKAIAFWYEGSRGQMVQQFPGVFSGGSGDPAKYGMVSIMRNVAEKGVHGDFDKVQQQLVRLIMVELDEMVEEARKMERAMKK